MERCIVTSSDAKYFPGLIALLRSLKKTNPHIPVIVFDNGLTPRQRFHVSRFARIERKEPFMKIPGRGKFSYIGDTPLLKFEIAELEYDMALYLDADIIVKGDLGPVFDIPRGRVGVVREMNTIRDMFRLRHREKMVGTLDINWKEKGFNAGVFVLYPGEWRDLKERAFVLVDKFGKEVFSKSKCQQLLNIIFSGSIYDLPGKYNVSPVYDKHIDDPGIIHYLCAEKPWHKTYPQGHRYPDFRANISAFEYPPILLTDLSRKK